MIPFKHTDERVWNAIHQIESAQREAQVCEVVVGPEIYVEMKIGRITSLTYFRGEDFLFGVPVSLDPSLRRGEIVLRHEVRI